MPLKLVGDKTKRYKVVSVKIDPALIEEAHRLGFDSFSEFVRFSVKNTLRQFKLWRFPLGKDFGKSQS